MAEKEVEFTLDELNTLRIHVSAIKEGLCNQRRYGDALEYQIIQDKLELIIKEVEKGKKNEK